MDTTWDKMQLLLVFKMRKGRGQMYRLPSPYCFKLTYISSLGRKRICRMLMLATVIRFCAAEKIIFFELKFDVLEK